MQKIILEVDPENQIELTRLGNGSPNILFISGVHGDEKTGAHITDNNPTTAANAIPMLERHIFRSKSEGLFTPQKNILTKVSKDETIGSIKFPAQTVEIRSELAGILLTVSRQRFLKTGEKLYVIGTE